MIILIPHRHRTHLLTALLIAGLAVTGCTEQPPASDAIGDAQELSSETTAPEKTVTPETPDAVKPLSPSECLIGTWLGDNDKFAAQVESFAGDDSFVEEVTGVVTLMLGADGSTSTSYTDWTITMTTEGQSVTLVRNGVDDGTYTVANDSLITMTETNSNSVLAMFANGAAAGSIPATNNLPLTDTSFTCSEDSLGFVSDLTNVEFARQ